MAGRYARSSGWYGVCLVRVPSPILDPTEQQRRPIAKARRARVEDRVRGVGPIRGREDRVASGPPKERVVGPLRHEIGASGGA